MGSCRGNCGDGTCDTCGCYICQYRDCDRGLPSGPFRCSKCKYKRDKLESIFEEYNVPEEAQEEIISVISWD